MVTRCTRKQENDIPDTDIRLSMGYVVSSSGYTLLVGPAKSEFRYDEGEWYSLQGKIKVEL